MKRHRKLLLFLFTPILLIAVLIALAFVPAVQTAVARRVLAAQPGITASVDHVAVGLTKVRINGLKFAQPGIMLDLPTLELDAPLLDAAKSKVHVQRLTANGWTATLSLPELAAASAQSTPSADTTPSAPFNGLFELIQLPVDLSIGTLESAGQVTLITAPGVRPIQVAAKLKGGNLAAGQTGKFTLSLQIEGVALPAALATATAATTETQRIEIETTIEARMSTPRSLENILLNLNAKTGAETALVKLAAYAANPAAGKPEEYSAFLDTKGTTRARVTGKWHPAPRTAEGDWMLNLGNTDLAPYAAAAGLTLPPFAADGQGAFTYALATGDATATGRLQVRGGLRDYIPELGNTELLLLTEFDAGLKSGHPRVEKFTATVSTGEPLVSIKTIQPFTLDTAKSTVTAADPTKDLLRIEIPGLPLTLVEPFLASSGIKLSGSPIRGAWVARLEGDTVRLATEQPLTLDITDLKQNGQTLAANLALSVQGLAATYSPKGWDATIGSITLATPNTKAAPALTLAAVARQLAGPGSSPITFDANGTMQPALLAAQPILAEYLQTLAAGKLTFTAQGTLADAIAAKASVKLDAFRIRATTTTSAATLPDVTLDADLARTAAGVLTIKTPITLTNASATPKRTSDLTINATLTPDPAKQTLDARAQITSNVFYIADAQAFAALAPPSPATTAPSTLDVGRSTLDVGRSAQSAAPPWAGLTGELSLALKKVVYTDELQITDIGGTIKITPEALTLDAIKAILGGASSLKLDGTLAYDAQKPAAAYALKTDLAVKNFETAPWLRALAAPSALDVGRSTLDVGRSAQSASPPPPVVLETKLNIDGHLTATAATLPAIADRAQGQFNIASVGGGICRALSGDLATRVNKLHSTASKATDIVSGIAGLLGKSSSKTTKVVDQTTAIIEGSKELADYFEEIKFDQFSLAATRGPDLNAVLQNLTLVSPELRLTGSGQITHAESTPLVKQALALNLNLAGKGQLSKLFEKTKLTGGPADASGYVPFFTPVKIGGTLEKVDTSAFTNAIIERVAQTGTGVLGNLLDKQ